MIYIWDLCIWDAQINFGFWIFNLGGIYSLDKDISKWDKDNLAELKIILEDMIPLIRFSLISANDFHEKIKPYKKVIDEHKYAELQYYYESDRWILECNPRIRNLLNLQMKHVIANWIDEKNRVYISSNLYCDFQLILHVTSR